MTEDLVVAVALLGKILGSVLTHAGPQVTMGFQADLAVGRVEAFDNSSLVTQDQAGGAGCG